MFTPFRQKKDIDEIIRAMQEKTEDITYYLNKETGEIVYVDENIAAQVEEDYDEADTVIEEWSHDFEDDDMYHENIYSPSDEVNEEELIKQIRFTKQDDFEPVPIVTLSEMKKIIFSFLDKTHSSDNNLIVTIKSIIKNLTTEEDIEQALTKHFGEKEKWKNYYEIILRNKVTIWLSSLGFDFK